ncbi:hypothetical protein FWG95_00950 [Candidatus Saccharibacteria bacterium]|nr:hypothetical protein [Candidatus Saccharibacteria bacterium]
MPEVLNVSPDAGREYQTDFDGTVVEKLGLFDPRNAMKYPLRKRCGYEDFVAGAEGEGLPLAGVVSARPDIWPRRLAMERSIRTQGLTEVFAGRPLLLLGNEGAKARKVLEGLAANDVVAEIDDKPQSIGQAIIRVALADPLLRGTAVVGAVEHEKTDLYLGIFKERMHRAGLTPVCQGNEITVVTDDRRFSLVVVRTGPYNEANGGRFAGLVLSCNAQAA